MFQIIKMSGLTINWVETSVGTSSVVTLGKTVENSLQSLQNQQLILIIPGNPGLAGMYEDFMTALSTSLGSDTSIWTFSHLGHHTKRPPILPSGSTYNLEEQIEHKLCLLEKLVPDTTQITLIGHSIGCKIIMEIFKRNKTHQIKEVFFLFPVIENILRTARGQETNNLVRWRISVIMITILLSLLPDGLLNFLIGKNYKGSSSTFRSGVVSFVNSNHVNNCLALVEDEFKVVLDLDCDTIRDMIGKLHILFGAEDGWCPLSYRDNLLASVPNFPLSEAVIDTTGIPHAFVEEHSEVCAEIVADWIKRNK